MEGVRFVTGAHVRSRIDVSAATLRNWADAGLVRFIVAPATKVRRYAFDDVAARCGHTEAAQAPKERCRVIYARVSSAHQRADLRRQVEDLQSRFPTHEVIQDVGSGLNFKRRGFQALLERVYAGDVEEVVVAHADRLCRFGRELVEFVFDKSGTRLVVCDLRRRASSTAELADDLLSVATVFVARENGLRSASKRRMRKRRREESEGGGGVEERDHAGAEDSGLPNEDTA